MAQLTNRQSAILILVSANIRLKASEIIEELDSKDVLGISEDILHLTIEGKLERDPDQNLRIAKKPLVILIES